MTTQPSALAPILREQDALVTRNQLRQYGVSRGLERAHLDGGRWRALNDAVICTHNGPLAPRQAAWAVLLSAQGPAALCGLTAMQLWGLVGFATPTVHVLVGRGLKVLRVPGVKVAVHESRRFRPADICLTRSPATTSLERSVVDAAVWSPDLNTAARIIVAPVQQRRTTAARLGTVLNSAGQVKFRKVLVPFIADLEGGAEALSEVEFLRWCRRNRFPAPELQIRRDSRGRRRYIDAVFRRADGSLVIVEIDGGVHLTLATRWLDTIKDNDSAISGELALRFPSVAIYANDSIAVSQLRRALDLRSDIRVVRTA